MLFQVIFGLAKTPLITDDRLRRVRANVNCKYNFDKNIARTQRIHVTAKSNYLTYFDGIL